MRLFVLCRVLIYRGKPVTFRTILVGSTYCACISHSCLASLALRNRSSLIGWIISQHELYSTWGRCYSGHFWRLSMGRVRICLLLCHCQLSGTLPVTMRAPCSASTEKSSPVTWPSSSSRRGLCVLHGVRRAHLGRRPACLKCFGMTSHLRFDWCQVFSLNDSTY